MKIFRSEDNRLPVIVWIVSILLIAFASGASGVSTYQQTSVHGGAVGEWINELVIPMFGNGVAIFVYAVLIAVCLLFILQKTPSAVARGLKGAIKGKNKEASAEVKDDRIEELEDGLYLEHYGTPRHSGRYPWGSGKNPYQHDSADWLARVDQLRARKNMDDRQISPRKETESSRCRKYPAECCCN